MMEELGQEHVAPRREFCHFAPERANVVHCYGVDFLSTKEVQEAFQKFDTKEVEWLDDSSCNVVFGEAIKASDVIKALALKGGSLGQQLDEHWTLSQPMQLGGAPSEPKQAAKAKARKTKAKEVQLQLRVATEADRKDPGHSGHTDSVYYTHVKEQQALQKQSAELRREKKRARVRRLPSTDAVSRLQQGADAAATPAIVASNPFASVPAPTAAAAIAAPAAAAAATAVAGGPAAMAGIDSVVPGIGGADVAAGVPKMGFRSLLDPLLFLRAPGLGGGAAPASASSPPGDAAATATGGDAAAGDLREMLRRAEAEYAAVQSATPATSSTPGAGDPAAPAVGAAKGDKARGHDGSRGPRGAHHERGGRQRDRTLGTPGGGRQRDRTPGTPGGGRQRDRTPGTPGGGRQWDRTPGTPGGRQRDRTPGGRTQEQRGKKRRPVEQEPRAVSETAAPARRPESLPAVEDFLKEHRVRCQRYTLNRTFRGILFGQQQKRKRQQQEAQQAQKASKSLAKAAAGAPAGGGGASTVAAELVNGRGAGGDDKMAVAEEPMAESSLSDKADEAGRPAVDNGARSLASMGDAENSGGDAKMAVADEPMAESSLSDKAGKGKKQKAPPAYKEELPPWDQYMRANNFFTKQGHFMHTIAWQAGDQKVYTVVPHPTRVDLDRLARATQVPKERIRQRKLKEISEDTGFPVFICTPIGLKPDAAGKRPVLLVDSAVTEYKKPLLFDCGSVGLSIPSSEFLRSTGAACIEGLGMQPPEAKGVGAAATAPPLAASARTASPAKSAPEPAPEPAPAPAEVLGPDPMEQEVVPMAT